MGRSARMAARLAIAVLAVALVACGDDDDDAGGGGGDNGDREAMVTALAGTGADEFSEEENRCLSEALVDTVGVEALEEADVVSQAEENPEGSLSDWGVELTDEQSEQFFEGVEQCVDLRTVFVESMAESGVPAEGAECIIDAVGEETFRDTMLASLTEGDEALDSDAELTAAFEQAGVTCAAELGGG